MQNSNKEVEEEIILLEGSDGLIKLVDGKEEPNYDVTINIFQEGDIVSGEVVRIDKDEILVDIGYKSEGVIPANELSIRKSVNTDDEVSIGDKVDALVMQKEDAEGRLILSKKRARFEQAWQRIQDVEQKGETIDGKVIEVVKGGLILDLGVRGFLPASLVDIRRIQNLDEYLDQVLNCRVIELNRSRNNVVLSRRAVLEEERKEVRQQILDNLKPGDIVTGVISNIVDFGAFVDLDGIDGLIHISELSWGHVNHPSEVLAVGDEVSVKVLDIDRERQRVSLGLKQTQEDPWQGLMDTYQVGDVLTGKVTKLVSFGTFVQVLDGIEGLVHISELADHHVEKPEEVVSVGDEIEVKVIEIDTDRRRLSLSIKRLQEDMGEREEAESEGAEEDAEPEAADESVTAEEPPEAAVEADSLNLSDDIFPDRPQEEVGGSEGEAVGPAAGDEAAAAVPGDSTGLELADDLEVVEDTAEAVEPAAEEDTAGDDTAEAEEPTAAGDNSEAEEPAAGDTGDTGEPGASEGETADEEEETS
ncbi:30S ribosomal protein S1 [bacterium BMS3Abin01]|nr:30S ribosomal protein S1 [bacterium BMS3Abin01]HDY69420.1 30S ribosomal protein S1 [Actinomycetota bacterium]